MKIVPLRQEDMQAVYDLMDKGAPFIRPRTLSDYWAYAKLFASTCPLAFIDGQVAGAVMAFRSQENPDEIYIQDVMTDPGFRRRGVTSALVSHVAQRGREWGCKRVYLTSEPENSAAHQTWMALGFDNIAGDLVVEGVSVTKDYKGPGKDRAVYELNL
jgi:GNAT superfamily N-acetyltransferase